MNTTRIFEEAAQVSGRLLFRDDDIVISVKPDDDGEQTICIVHVENGASVHVHFNVPESISDDKQLLMLAKIFADGMARGAGLVRDGLYPARDVVRRAYDVSIGVEDHLEE